MVASSVLEPIIEDGVKVTFDLDTPKIKFEDLTDYQTAGVDIAGGVTVKGILKTTSPTGANLYTNVGWSAGYLTPDTDIDSDRIHDNITFPNDANGNPLQGTYKFEYNLQIDYTAVGGSVQTLNLVINKEYCVTLPIVAIGFEVDCLCGKLISSDETDLLIDGVLPTVDSRTHTIKYPSGLQKADVVSSSKQITVSPIYTKTWTTIIELTLTYDFSSLGICVIGSVEGNEENLIECEAKLCDLYCCVTQTYKRAVKYRVRNEVKYLEELEIFKEVLAYVQLYQLAGECNVTIDQNQLYQDILDRAECSAGCGCTSGEPQQIIPTCGSSAGAGASTVSEGAGIKVTISMAGGITDYNVAIDPAVIAQINAATNTVLTTNTPTLIGLVDLGDGDWRIDWLGGGNTLQLLDFFLDINWTSASTVSITISEVTNIGSRFKAPVVGSVTMAAGINAYFSFGTFLVDATADAKIDKVLIQHVQPNMTGIGVGGSFVNPRYAVPEIYFVGHGSFGVLWYLASMIAGGSGVPAKQAFMYTLQRYNKLHIQIIGT